MSTNLDRAARPQGRASSSPTAWPTSARTSRSSCGGSRRSAPLPADAGNYAGGPATAPKATGISKPDKTAPTGIAVVKELAVGATAKSFTPDRPCYLK
jgi:hypothetical protein